MAGWKEQAMSRGVRLVLLATALALAAAGCGGGGRLSKADYEQKLKDAGAGLSTAVAKLSAARSKDDFQEGAGAVQKAFEDAADDLGGSKPPEDVESANARLVSALHDLADEFGEVKKAAEQGPDAARKKGQELSSSAASKQANLAIKEIQRRGYDVGRLGS